MEPETIAILEKYSHITGLKKNVVKKKTSRRGSTSCIVQHKEKENKMSPKITHMCSRDLNRLLP
jgi:hypothetical protein